MIMMIIVINDSFFLPVLLAHYWYFFISEDTLIDPMQTLKDDTGPFIRRQASCRLTKQPLPLIVYSVDRIFVWDEKRKDWRKSWNIHGLVQDCSISSALTMELLQSSRNHQYVVYRMEL